MRINHVRMAAAVMAVAAFAAGCSVIPGWDDEPEPVVIGVDLNLTGRNSELGVVFHDALQLQAERINSRGRSEDRPLQLEVRDNRGDQQSSLSNITDLRADPDVVAIVTAGCPTCVVDLAPELTLPVVSLDPDTAVAAPAGERHWVFRLGPDAADVADMLSGEMAQADAGTVGIIASNTPYGREGSAALTDAAGRDELTVVQHHQVDLDQAEAVASAVRQLAQWQPEPDPFAVEPPDDQTGPDAAVVWASTPHAAGLVQALREAGYSGPVYLDMLAADELFFTENLGEATMVFTDTLVVDTRIATSPALAERQRWVSEYISRYGAYAAQSSFAADALLVISDAMRRADQPDRATLRDNIESTRVDGLTGQLRFTGDQHSGLHPISLTVLTADSDRWR